MNAKQIAEEMLAQFKESLVDYQNALNEESGVTDDQFIIVVGDLPVNISDEVGIDLKRRVKVGRAFEVTRYGYREAFMLASQCSNGLGQQGVARFWRDVVKEKIDFFKEMIIVCEKRLEEL